MMTALHQVQSAALIEVLHDNPQLKPGDALLVMGSKVASLTLPSVQTQLATLDLRLYTLATDLIALGINHQTSGYGKVINDTEWVDLSLRHHPVHSY